MVAGVVGDDLGAEEGTSSSANSMAQMKSEHNWLTNHFFAAGTRARIRDNAIARLWWLARYASEIPGVSQAEGLNILIGLDQDIASTILGRPSIAAAPNLMEAIFSAVSADPDFLTMNSSARRIRFRNFMKEIDLVAGRDVAGPPDDAIAAPGMDRHRQQGSGPSNRLSAAAGRADERGEPARWCARDNARWRDGAGDLAFAHDC